MAEHRSPEPLFSDAIYKTIRRLAEYGFPALIALYFALSEAWHWGNQAEIMASLAAVNVFLGAVVGVSRRTWQNSDAPYDGDLVIDTRDPDRDLATLDLTTMPEDIRDMNAATFRVKRLE